MCRFSGSSPSLPRSAKLTDAAAPTGAGSRSACFRCMRAMNHRRNDNRCPQAAGDAQAVACANATMPASPLRYYGGLQAYARKIAEMLPTHDRYAEPFAGGASVLLSKCASATARCNQSQDRRSLSAPFLFALRRQPLPPLMYVLSFVFFGGGLRSRAHSRRRSRDTP